MWSKEGSRVFSAYHVCIQIVLTAYKIIAEGLSVKDNQRLLDVGGGNRGLEEFEGPSCHPRESLPHPCWEACSYLCILPALKWEEDSVLFSLISTGSRSQHRQSLDASLPGEQPWPQSSGLPALQGGKQEYGQAGK